MNVVIVKVRRCWQSIDPYHHGSYSSAFLPVLVVGIPSNIATRADTGWIDRLLHVRRWESTESTGLGLVLTHDRAGLGGRAVRRLPANACELWCYGCKLKVIMVKRVLVLYLLPMRLLLPSSEFFLLPSSSSSSSHLSSSSSSSSEFIFLVVFELLPRPSSYWHCFLSFLYSSCRWCFWWGWGW